MTPTYEPRGPVQHLLHVVLLGAATALHLAADLIESRHRRCDRCAAGHVLPPGGITTPIDRDPA